jgi:flagellin
MISINTNTSSTLAATNLQRSSDLLQRSLARLSSGTRIATPSDDAGGLAVSMKLSAAAKRVQAASNNVSNALSYLQVQAGALKTASSVLDRISELITLSGDVTKSSTDIANYSTELSGLSNELVTLGAQSFNGIPLFNASSGTTAGLSVYLNQDGSQNMTIGSTQDLTNVASLTGMAATLDSSNLTQNLAAVTASIQTLASAMATNGAQSNRLQFALDALNMDSVNLEAANSRIYDVDVAVETSKLARANILVQSGAAMLTQANASQSIALKLLQ